MVTVSKPRPTLEDLNRMKSVVSVRRLATVCGMNVMTLKSRIRRKDPELTAEERDTIVQALAKAGLQLK